MIYADRPRRYSGKGLRWSHVCSPSLEDLIKYARKHGLRRKHRTPWIHYDVTAAELEELPDITIVSSRELVRIMKPYRQPRATQRQIQTKKSDSSIRN